jgi:hypothetical protein
LKSLIVVVGQLLLSYIHLATTGVKGAVEEKCEMYSRRIVCCADDAVLKTRGRAGGLSALEAPHPALPVFNSTKEYWDDRIESQEGGRSDTSNALFRNKKKYSRFEHDNHMKGKEDR